MQQRVAQLQVVDDRGTGARRRVLRTSAPRTTPTCQPRCLGPQRQLGLLAVGEVALVEQPHVARGTRAGPASACRGGSRRAPSPRRPWPGPGWRRSSGRRPASGRRRRRPTPARPGAGPSTASTSRAQAARRAGLASWGHTASHGAGSWAQEPAEADVGAGPEAGVGAQLEHVDVGRAAPPRTAPRPPGREPLSTTTIAGRRARLGEERAATRVAATRLRLVRGAR